MKCPSTATRRPILIHFDSAGPDPSEGTSDYLKEFNFPPVRRPPFLPDLTPSDFYLFETIEREIVGRNSEMLRTCR
jgi:hypothetical protein